MSVVLQDTPAAPQDAPVVSHDIPVASLDTPGASQDTPVAPFSDALKWAIEDFPKFWQRERERLVFDEILKVTRVKFCARAY